jgi:inhibitor of Bruton tyrosine kinase
VEPTLGTCMTSLHAHFYVRNQQAFQRLLDQSNDAHILRTSSGSSKTPPRATALTAESQDRDMNARDWLGRTVLHLACAATDPSALNFVRMLLGPNVKVDVNMRDVESQWTALHRALYAGNLPAA